MKNYITLFKKKNTHRHIGVMIFAIVLILIGAGLLSPFYLPVTKVGKDQKVTSINDALEQNSIFPFEIDLHSEDITYIDYFTYSKNSKSTAPYQDMMIAQIDGEPVNIMILSKTFDAAFAPDVTSYWVRVTPMSTSDSSWYHSDMLNIMSKEESGDLDAETQSHLQDIRTNIGPRSIFLEQKVFTLGDNILVLALALIIIGVIMLINVLIKLIRDGKKLEEDIRTSSTQMGIAPTELVDLVNTDLASESILFEQKNFMFTRDWILANDKRNVRLIPANYIIWAYLLRTTTRTNFVVTHVSYSIILYSLTSPHPVTIVLPNEATAENVLLAIEKISPYAFIGADNECKKRVRKYDTFIQYWYSEKAKKEQFEASQPTENVSVIIEESIPELDDNTPKSDQD